MFERFADPARRAIVLAREAAEELGTDQVRTEHVLLGLVEGGGSGGRALVDAGASPEAVRARLEAEGGGDGPPDGAPEFTRGAKQLFERALREALQAGARSIGTTHLALALLRDQDSSAVRLLRELGVERDAARVHVLETAPRDGETASGPQRARPVRPSPQLSPSSQQVLQSSMRAALQLGQGYLVRRYPPIGLLHTATSAARAGTPTPGASPGDAPSAGRGAVPHGAIAPAVCSFCGTESPACGALFVGAAGALICEGCVADASRARSTEPDGAREDGGGGDGAREDGGRQDNGGPEDRGRDGARG